MVTAREVRDFLDVMVNNGSGDAELVIDLWSISQLNVEQSRTGACGLSVALSKGNDKNSKEYLIVSPDNALRASAHWQIVAAMNECEISR